MTISKRIAGLLGPTLMAVLASEYPAVQPHLYDEQIPPVVYLSGLFMFVAGLSIVRWHNHWRRDWTLSVTLSGWFLLALGAVRMFAAGMYRRASRDAGAGFFIIGEAILFAIGILMPGRRTGATPRRTRAPTGCITRAAERVAGIARDRRLPARQDAKNGRTRSR